MPLRPLQKAVAIPRGLTVPCPDSNPGLDSCRQSILLGFRNTRSVALFFAGILLSAILTLTTTTPAAAQQSLYSEIDRLLEEGITPEVIFNDAVSKGDSIFRIIDAAVRADSLREAEFRLLGLSMLSGLPRSACVGTSYEPQRPWNSVEYDRLSPKTVSEVARLFFEEDEQLTRLNSSDSHGEFSVEELAKFQSEDTFWYRILPVRDHPLPDVLFVSLYLESRQVVIDGNLGRLERAIKSGETTVPVVFQYNRGKFIPTSDFSSENGGEAIIDAYESDGFKLTQAPNWRSGDFHSMMLISDLDVRFEIPEREDIDDQLWLRINEDLRQNGFTFPILIILHGTEATLHYSAERISVARSLGETIVPVAFFYAPVDVRLGNSGCARLIAGEERGDLNGVFGQLGLNSLRGNPGGPPAPEVQPQPVLPPPPPTPPLPPLLPPAPPTPPPPPPPPPRPPPVSD